MNEYQNEVEITTQLFKADDVAEILNVSRSFAYELIQTGQIPAVRLGRSVRVRPKDLEEFIQLNLSNSFRSI